MSDIVERLRHASSQGDAGPGVCRVLTAEASDAADEITRLRAEVERLTAEWANNPLTHQLIRHNEIIETKVERLREALEWIDGQRYTDRNTISSDNAFEMACKLNKRLVEIMDRARAALEEKP